MAEIKIANATIKVDDRGLDKDQRALLYVIIVREGYGMQVPSSLEDFEKNFLRRKFRKGEIDELAKAYDRSLECAQRIKEIQDRQPTIGQLAGIKPKSLPAQIVDQNGKPAISATGSDTEKPGQTISTVQPVKDEDQSK